MFNIIVKNSIIRATELMQNPNSECLSFFSILIMNNQSLKHKCESIEILGNNDLYYVFVRIGDSKKKLFMLDKNLLSHWRRLNIDFSSLSEKFGSYFLHNRWDQVPKECMLGYFTYAESGFQSRFLFDPKITYHILPREEIQKSMANILPLLFGGTRILGKTIHIKKYLGKYSLKSTNPDDRSFILSEDDLCIYNNPLDDRSFSRINTLCYKIQGKKIVGKLYLVIQEREIYDCHIFGSRRRLEYLQEIWDTFVNDLLAQFNLNGKILYVIVNKESLEFWYQTPARKNICCYYFIVPKGWWSVGRNLWFRLFQIRRLGGPLPTLLLPDLNWPSNLQPFFRVNYIATLNNLINNQRAHEIYMSSLTFQNGNRNQIVWLNSPMACNKMISLAEFLTLVIKPDKSTVVIFQNKINIYDDRKRVLKVIIEKNLQLSTLKQINIIRRMDGKILTKPTEQMKKMLNDDPSAVFELKLENEDNLILQNVKNPEKFIQLDIFENQKGSFCENLQQIISAPFVKKQEGNYPISDDSEDDQYL